MLRDKWSQITFDKAQKRLEQNIFPTLGEKNIGEISTSMLSVELESVSQRSVDECNRTLQHCTKIFNFAIKRGRALVNHALPLKGEFGSARYGHHAALVAPQEFARLLIAIDGYIGSGATVRNALRLAPLVFVRPGELRKGEWSEIDLNEARWVIRADRMKSRNRTEVAPHVVPLSAQAIQILREQKSVSGRGKYVFPSHLSDARPMSENAVLVALRLMGFSRVEMTGHGFRAIARTLLVEKLKAQDTWVEQQLAHEVKDLNGRAYNRTTFIDDREKMMQIWSDYIDRLKVPGSIENSGRVSLDLIRRMKAEVAVDGPE